MKTFEERYNEAVEEETRRQLRDRLEIVAKALEQAPLANHDTFVLATALIAAQKDADRRTYGFLWQVPDLLQGEHDTLRDYKKGLRNNVAAELAGRILIKFPGGEGR